MLVGLSIVQAIRIVYIYSGLCWERLEDHWPKQRLEDYLQRNSSLFAKNIVPNHNGQNQYQLCNMTTYPIPRTKTSNYKKIFLLKQLMIGDECKIVHLPKIGYKTMGSTLIVHI